MTAYALRERAGKQGGGKGALIQTEKTGTVGTANDQVIIEIMEQKETIALAGNTIGIKPTNGGNGNGFETDGKMYTLTATDIHGVCYDMTHACDVIRESGDKTPTLKARMGTGGNNVPLTMEGIAQATQVRRLTPTECERLQGFPDGYTKIAYRGKSADECPDSPRYKAIGNSWAVPVVRWIGKRIEGVLIGVIK